MLCAEIIGYGSRGPLYRLKDRMAILVSPAVNASLRRSSAPRAISVLLAPMVVHANTAPVNGLALNGPSLDIRQITLGFHAPIDCLVVLL